MSYILGARSLNNLVGVYPPAGFVVTEAIKVTKQDFTVFDGVRTAKEQRIYVADGFSDTNDSYHLYGLAVDLVPWINGRARWEEAPCAVIARSVLEVAKAHGIPLDWAVDLWGADWVHFQMTGMKEKYDVRKLEFFINQ